MTTPGKPRQSGIPTPGRTSIPTPGRPRSVSSALQQTQPTDADFMSRALADAIKANDPAQHRTSQGDSQSLSPHPLQSGRGSVAERFNVSRPSERAKTPAIPKPNNRPPSRHSDVFAKSLNRQFEVGDSVRIDSLGLEGTLRHMGEIEGKSGLWAGVELSVQFAGRGKNNGSVNGTQYFSCPDNCGVFVATTKLSPACLRQTNVARPPSVASSRNGRVTPSFSGRNTPSLSTSRVPSLSMSSGRTTPSFNGRVTPSLSSGRITPGFTPSIKSNYLSKSTVSTKSDYWKIPERITPGSRAAKYANMTAKQLNSRKGQDGSPVRGVGERQSSIPSSPSPVSRTLSSPSRPLSSPFSTPKPGLSGRVSNMGPSLPSTRGRPSNNTPRVRIPSAVAMPPPASPVSLAPRSASLDKPEMEEITLTSLELQGKAIQDQIAFLMTDVVEASSHRSESAGSSHSNVTEGQLEHLRARLEALESENGRLRSEKERMEADVQSGLIQHLREDRDRAAEDASRMSEEKDKLLKMHESTAANLEQLQELHHASQRRVDELEGHLADQQSESQRTTRALNDNLAEALSIQKKLEEENLLLRAAKADLATQVEELGTQVDELRLAGQETIALYEERLNIADSQRYDLECRIAILENGNKSQETDIQTARSSSHASAAEIDNETLRDQLIHLQKKIATMEDIIEDSRIASEKEEAVVRERMKKLKEKEDSMKSELTEGRREVERMAKAETHARSRVEEIEEALRESQVALENARAEIESLRAELSNAGNLPNSAPQPESEQSEDLRSENLRLQSQNNELLMQIADLMNNPTEHTNESGRRKLGRDASLTSGDDSKIFVPSPSKHEMSTREEITGLKHIVQELQKENQILQSETEHLRQEVRILENSLDNSAINDSPETEGLGRPCDTEALQRLLKEQKTRHEADDEQLRRRMVEMEMKHARATHDLNKEIGELEALVESKIYREDELEQEVERLKDKLSKMKKSTKNGGEGGDSRHRTSSASTNSSDAENSRTANESVCEICERPGHDIFNCDLLKEDVPTTLSRTRASEDKFCSDCETWGHTLSDCPHSQDVF